MDGGLQSLNSVLHKSSLWHLKVMRLATSHASWYFKPVKIITRTRSWIDYNKSSCSKIKLG